MIHTNPMVKYILTKTYMWQKIDGRNMQLNFALLSKNICQ